jgi:hypothetical protein
VVPHHLLDEDGRDINAHICDVARPGSLGLLPVGQRLRASGWRQRLGVDNSGPAQYRGETAPTVAYRR